MMKPEARVSAPMFQEAVKTEDIGVSIRIALIPKLRRDCRVPVEATNRIPSALQG